MNTKKMIIKIQKLIVKLSIHTKLIGEWLHRTVSILYNSFQKRMQKVRTYFEQRHRKITKSGSSGDIVSNINLLRKRLLLLMMGDKRKTAAIAAMFISIVVAILLSFPPVPFLQKEPKSSLVAIPPGHIVPEAVLPSDIVVKRTDDERQLEQLPILDLSGIRADMKSNMRQINEPTAWGEEVLFSAGDASSIDGPVLTKLLLYNFDTHEETEIAASNVRFGEIYEGRISDSWIVWLDTNQSGINHIYALNRSTGKNIRVNSTSMNRPQISLSEDFLIWTGQKEEYQDEMHVFNLSTGRSMKVEEFDNPTFGTSSPAVSGNLLVWAYPHPEDPSVRSVIKILDLTELNLDTQTIEDQPVIEEEAAVQEETSLNFDIQSIDPDGFAIYPATNGEAIAWLNSLNPAQSALKLTLDKGKTIMTVAEGVGRFFGIGEDFIVYTQQGRIKLYFWETRRFATLTKEDELGKLSELPVSGRTIIWYDATDPNRKQDNVKRSVIDNLP